MGHERTRNLITYLRNLAPDFFQSRMYGASADDVARLEETAKTQMSDCHKEFLLAFGNTPATMLNPFLNDRDYCINTLLSAYSWHHEYTQPIPSGIVYFSASEILSETILLRHGETTEVDPEVGDIRPETGDFIAKDLRFVSWLEWFAFVFRISQPDHQVGFEALWDETRLRWVAEPEMTWEILNSMGFKEIFIFENGIRCADRGDVAAILHDDGSGTLAGDDLEELREIQRVLTEDLPVRLRLTQENYRMYAPRK